MEGEPNQFILDAEHCSAVEFDTKIINTQPGGPKAGGKAPVNDTPDGALSIPIGRRVNDQTRGPAPDAELPVTTCPESDDAFGHTVWYSFTGNGEAVTIDTAGSNFDTVIAVYDEELVELACNDDVEFEPLGATFQAALTIDTVEGATYYIQAGGYLNTFEGLDAEFGRLRLSIE